MVYCMVAWDCFDSIICLENNLNNVLETRKEISRQYIPLTAIIIWSKFGGNKENCRILLLLLRSYSDGEPPYDMEYTDDYDIPELWWSTYQQPNNYIQKLALKLDIDQIQSMAQMHLYYITNAKTELKFSSSGLNENELETALQEITAAMINNNVLFIDDDDDDTVSDNESINLNEDNTNSDLIMENTMKLDKFNELNRDNSNSDIFVQRPDESIYYEDSNIDFEAIFDEESEINQ
ncbi:hypothetical protein RhiirC2_781632 [Rhizophagus irregularis]|uniref:HAT C-terminal dimerisation domain-containing protein n=1 Tax=Rhizophagus irregularis TaxID=588596 RepID=A0A2N1N4Y3_9GLOM|nr:hypothetical protein RhiirC2_781632 [Rhizophagus irregularis]